MAHSFSQGRDGWHWPITQQTESFVLQTWCTRLADLHRRSSRSFKKVGFVFIQCTFQGLIFIFILECFCRVTCLIVSWFSTMFGSRRWLKLSLFRSEFWSQQEMSVSWIMSEDSSKLWKSGKLMGLPLYEVSLYHEETVLISDEWSHETDCSTIQIRIKYLVQFKFNSTVLTNRHFSWMPCIFIN